MAFDTTTAKATAVSMGEMPNSEPRATPPKAEWATPTPTKDKRRKTTKNETTARTRLNMIPAKKAFCINLRPNNSIIVFMPVVTGYAFGFVNDKFKVFTIYLLSDIWQKTGVGFTMMVKLSVEAGDSIRMCGNDSDIM